MPSGDDPEQNIAVIVSRLNYLEQALNDHGVTLSNTRERVAYLERDKLPRSDFEAWAHDAREWRETVVKHLERLDGRLGAWAAGSAVLTGIAAAIAALIGRSP